MWVSDWWRAGRSTGRFRSAGWVKKLLHDHKVLAAGPLASCFHLWGKKRDKTACLSFAFLFNAPLWGMLCIPFDVTDEEGEEGKGLHSVWRRAALWVKQRKRETNKRLPLCPLATTFLALLKVLQLPVYFLVLQPTLCIWQCSPPVACRHWGDLGLFLIIWVFFSVTHKSLWLLIGEQVLSVLQNNTKGWLTA